jgi:hypothetical protein
MALDDLSDVTITSATNGQALIYNSGTWINGNPTSASYATTASYATVAQTLLGSVTSASYAATASWAINAFTASIATSASYALTSSLATSASYSSTASFAITASLAVTASYVSNLNKKVRTTVPFMAVQGQTTYITNIPSTVDEIGTELRIKENLSNVASCSLSGRVEEATAGLIGFIKAQYSTDEVTWNDLMSSTTSLIDLSSATTQVGTEVPVPSGAKTTGTYIRLITISGSGASDANARFGNISLNLIYDL